jgi:HSP20 family protein
MKSALIGREETMTLSVYRPSHMADAIQRFFDESFVRSYRRPHVIEDAPLPLDVQDKDDAYIITATVPSLKPEDVNIEIQNNTVTIRGEVVAPEYDDQAQWVLQERSYGKFSRTLTFRVELDSVKAEATVENGLLTLRVPKAETAKPRMVKIQAK